jgi:hypothetical protein
MGHMEDKMEKGLIFKEIKTGNLFEAYLIDHKSGRVGGYKIFAAFGESNPFRIFGFDDVKFHNVHEPPTEEPLA